MRASFYLFLAIAILAVVVSGEDAEDGKQVAKKAICEAMAQYLPTSRVLQMKLFHSCFQEDIKERGFGMMFGKVGEKFGEKGQKGYLLEWWWCWFR